MKRAIVASLLVCALVATAGCLEDGDTEATTMTYNDFSRDYNQSRDNETQTIFVYLESLDEGDTVVIQDQLQNLTYREQGNESMTLIQFSSYPRQYQAIEGDVTDEFQPGDNVTLTSEIINTTFTSLQYPVQGENWTIHYETFKDGWDTKNDIQSPFPQSAIEHAKDTKEDGDTDDTDDTGNDTDSNTLSFYEFQRDYKQSRNNETKTLVVYLDSFDEGDTVVIKDQLQNLTYNDTRGITILQFSSYPRGALTIEGDVTDEFQAGDKVTVTSDVANTTFTYPLQRGQEWTVHYETLTEWDAENNTQAPFPQAALQHADGS